MKNTAAMQAKMHIINATDAAILKWQLENTTEDIEEEVFKVLNKSKQKVLLAALGIKKDTWGSRANNYLFDSQGDAMNTIQHSIRTAVANWVKHEGLPGISDATKRRAIDEYQTELKEFVEAKWHGQVSQLLAKAKDEFIHDLDATALLTMQTKLKDLILEE